jgi:hypothetical protein
MSEEIDRAPEPDLFPSARSWVGIFALLVTLCVLVYGAARLPGLFESAAPIADATPRSSSAPAVTPPQPGCRHGTGTCDWAGLHSPRLPCQFGAGACDWAGLRAPPSTCGETGTCDTAAPPPHGCHYGTGRCDWAGNGERL